MKKYSALPCEIKSLNREITAFEDNYNKGLADAACNSDCYCRKQGNHKVTKGLYHKDCITMKKGASVLKTDILPPRRKCHERIDVFNLNKSRVEVAVKKPLKDKKLESKPTVKSEVQKQIVKFIDQGTDPITVVESKVSVKQSWSDILTHNSKSNAPQSSSYNKRSTEQGTNYKSTSSESPKYHSSGSSSPISSYKNKQKIVVRDKGTQSLDEITKGDLIPVLLPRIQDSISNPLISLQALVKELKDFKRRVPNQKDYNIICCIISEMEIALNVLTQHGKPTPYYSSNKTSGSSCIESKENGAKSTKSERLYKSLEDTCSQLKVACQHLEETCDKLRNEKDHVTEQFFEKSKEVESCLKRELDYQNKLTKATKEASSMSLQLDQCNRSLEELSDKIKKLQEENKAFEKAEEEKVRLHAQLMDASRENDKLNAELQLLTLEREKNRVLLDIKEKELSKLRKQLLNIGGLVSEKMENVMGGDNLLYSRLGSTATHMDLDLSDTKGHEIAFSSPDGSITSPSKSWKAMSSIASFSKQQQVMTLQESSHKSDELKRNHKGDTPPLESIKHLKNELRELFAQMKKQTAVSEALLLPELRTGSDSTVWSSITDSSDGYISITDADCSGQET